MRGCRLVDWCGQDVADGGQVWVSWVIVGTTSRAVTRSPAISTTRGAASSRVVCGAAAGSGEYPTLDVVVRKFSDDAGADVSGGAADED